MMEEMLILMLEGLTEIRSLLVLVVLVALVVVVSRFLSVAGVSDVSHFVMMDLNLTDFDMTILMPVLAQMVSLLIWTLMATAILIMGELWIVFLLSCYYYSYFHS